jgi:molybdate transport system substrate-binding protein
VENGAPFDVILSADEGYVEALAGKGLVAKDGVFRYGRGRLVLWAPPSAKVGEGPLVLALLTRPAIRKIAIANPRTAPYGRAAVGVLQAAGIHDAVKAKLVLGDSVSQAAQFAESGAADVAMLPRSYTAQGPLAGKGKVGELSDPAASLPQAGAILTRAKHPDLARAFATFLQGEEAQALLRKNGFEPP